MNSYIVGVPIEDIRSFFSVLPEEKRPKIVSDKEFPGIWDHPSDQPTVIATEEPRVDTEAKELIITDRQVDDVMKELCPEPEVVTEEPALELPKAPEEEEPVHGPMTYADRGFKVGRMS